MTTTAKINLLSWLKKPILSTVAYLKKKEKQNLLSCMLLVISGLVFCLQGIFHLYNTFATVSVNLMNIDTLIADISVSALMIAPILVFTSVAYMVWEKHSLGWKLSATISVLAIALGAGGAVNIEVSLLVAFLCGLGGALEFRNLQGQQKTKDSPLVTENLAKLGLRLSGLLCLTILLGAVLYVIIRGSPYLSLGFLAPTKWSWANAYEVFAGKSTQMGGVGSFAIGSLLLVGMCELIALPLGLGAAIYLSEYAKQGWLIHIIRFFIETLAGIPSVVIGLFGFFFFVGELGLGYGSIAAALSLSFMILPWNIRIAEESLKSVPMAYREASFALGASQWQTVRKSVLFAALPGILTGFLLGVGAAMGETAVVLYTSGLTAGTLPPIAQLFSLKSGPIPTLTVFVYQCKDSFQFNANVMGKVTNLSFDIQSLLFAGASILILMYLAICIVGLLVRNYLSKKIKGQ